MKPKSRIDVVLQILFAVLAITTLILVFLSRSFFINESSVYGKF
jgi:hypothetical protein